MPKFDWFWFLAGILVNMFLFPILSQMIGRMKGQAATKKVA